VVVVSQDPWFRVRASGLGWTPITWQGWLVAGLGVLAVMAVNLLILARAGAFRQHGGG
jgi:hypothetical protein